MTKLATWALAALALAACAQPPAPPPAPPQAEAVDAPSGRYVSDPAHTSLVVRADHLGLSHYTLRLTGVNATLNFNAEHPEQSSVEAAIDAASVATEFRGARDFNAELENSQWLDAGRHPLVSFKSTSVELTAPDAARVSGDLTIRGITKPITLDVIFNRAYRQHPFGQPGALLGFSARGGFNRSEFGMNELLPQGANGVGIGDNVEIIIEAEFAQQAPPANPVN